MAILAAVLGKVPEMAAFITKNPDKSIAVFAILGLLLFNALYVFFFLVPSALRNFSIATNVSIINHFLPNHIFAFRSR